MNTCSAGFEVHTSVRRGVVPIADATTATAPGGKFKLPGASWFQKKPQPENSTSTITKPRQTALAAGDNSQFL